jgi:hypothetical protein
MSLGEIGSNYINMAVGDERQIGQIEDRGSHSSDDVMCGLLV